MKGLRTGFLKLLTAALLCSCSIQGISQTNDKKIPSSLWLRQKLDAYFETESTPVAYQINTSSHASVNAGGSAYSVMQVLSGGVERDGLKRGTCSLAIFDREKDYLFVLTPHLETPLLADQLDPCVSFSNPRKIQLKTSIALAYDADFYDPPSDSTYDRVVIFIIDEDAELCYAESLSNQLNDMPGIADKLSAENIEPLQPACM